MSYLGSTNGQDWTGIEVAPSIFMSSTRMDSDVLLRRHIGLVIESYGDTKLSAVTNAGVVHYKTLKYKDSDFLQDFGTHIDAILAIKVRHRLRTLIYDMDRTRDEHSRANTIVHAVNIYEDRKYWFSKGYGRLNGIDGELTTAHIKDLMAYHVSCKRHSTDGC
jgi:hypothetical protein